MNERTTLIGWLVDAVEGRDISWSVAILRPLGAGLTWWCTGLGIPPFIDLHPLAHTIAFSFMLVFGFALAVKLFKKTEQPTINFLQTTWTSKFIIQNLTYEEKLFIEDTFKTNGLINQIYKIKFKNNHSKEVDNLISKNIIITCTQKELINGKENIIQQSVILRKDIRMYLHNKCKSTETFQSDKELLKRLTSRQP